MAEASIPGRSFLEDVRQARSDTDEHVVPPLLALAAYSAVGLPLRVWLTLHRDDPRAPTVTIGGVHIHHEVPGVGLLLGSGVVAMDDKFPYARAIAFGIGSVLVLDEALLLIDLNAEDYWKAANLAALAGGVLLLGANVVIARDFYAKVAKLAVGHARQKIRDLRIRRARSSLIA
jgi:hypothetical protein